MKHESAYNKAIKAGLRFSAPFGDVGASMLAAERKRRAARMIAYIERMKAGKS